MRREDDRATRWIRNEWSPADVGWDNYEFAMIVARFLNWPDTLELLTEIIGEFSTNERNLLTERIFRVMEDLAFEKKKVWGNAYVVTTHGIPMGKAAYLCQRVLPAAYELVGAGRWRQQYPNDGPTLAARHGVLMQLEGLGSFMAGQVIADLKNTVGHPLNTAVDFDTWSAPGPGSWRGMQWFYGFKPKHWDDAIGFVREYVNRETGFDLHAQDIQNCLCEFDKYMRVKTGAGRSKRGYPGK